MITNLSGTEWFKSSYSGEGGNDCVEIAWLASGYVGIRDSKNPEGPALVFTPTEWDTFTTTIQSSKFPHPQ
ncbi:DUF397 domain-containing protein [Nocardia sp. NPDC051570]|uniref:DUF397 domain-containing protein n=1 Tax=Nocardia sp. NPDC051570 TaxID=3364324 RepID=UPI00378B7EE0